MADVCSFPSRRTINLTSRRTAAISVLYSSCHFRKENVAIRFGGHGLEHSEAIPFEDGGKAVLVRRSLVPTC